MLLSRLSWQHSTLIQTKPRTVTPAPGRQKSRNWHDRAGANLPTSGIQKNILNYPTRTIESCNVSTVKYSGRTGAEWTRFYCTCLSQFGPTVWNPWRRLDHASQTSWVLTCSLHLTYSSHLSQLSLATRHNQIYQESQAWE